MRGYSTDNIEKLKELLKFCLKGESTSIMRFQEEFGEDIYNFPVKARGVDIDKASDFYCYCFEKGRIFKRMLTYKGICSLRTYQYHVLNDLCNEWGRTEMLHSIPTVSLNSPVNPESGTEIIDLLEDEDSTSPMVFDSETNTLDTFKQMLKQLPNEEGIYIKLLAYHEAGLDVEDIRVISKISKRPLNEVMKSLVEIDKRLSEKDEVYAERLAKLNEVEVRIIHIERKLKTLRQKVQEKMESSDEIAELERKLRWRYEQKDKILRLYKTTLVRLSFRDIARLLSVSLGTVSTRVKEIKEKFAGYFNEGSNEKSKKH